MKTGRDQALLLGVLAGLPLLAIAILLIATWLRHLLGG